MNLPFGILHIHWQTSRSILQTIPHGRHHNSHLCFNTTSDPSLCERPPDDLGNGQNSWRAVLTRGWPGKQVGKHELHQHIPPKPNKGVTSPPFLSCLSKISLNSNVSEPMKKRDKLSVEKYCECCQNLLQTVQISTFWVHGYTHCWASPEPQELLHELKNVLKNEHTQKMYCSKGLSIRITIHLLLCPTIIWSVYTWPLQYLHPTKDKMYYLNY